MRTGVRSLLWACSWLGVLFVAPAAGGADLPEYRLKAAFVYNFIVYTDWPAQTRSTLNVCILGDDPFGQEIDGLRGKVVADRSIAVSRHPIGAPLTNCQVVFIAASAMPNLQGVLDDLRGRAVLTVADSPGAIRQGVALNMVVSNGRVSFEANLQAARRAGLTLSSKLLRLATEVRQ